MRSQALHRLLALLLCLMFAGPWSVTSGDQSYLSVQELYAQSDLVVMGEYLGNDNVRLSKDGSPASLGVIRVDSLVKGSGRHAVVYLLLPPMRPGGLLSSTELVFEKGQQGLWYLKLRSEGIYQIDRPDRFVPMAAVEQQLKQLKLK